MVGSAVAGIRSMAKSDLRASASKMAGAVRYFSTAPRPRARFIAWCWTSTRPLLGRGNGRPLRHGRRRETEESRKREADKLAKEAEESAKRAMRRRAWRRCRRATSRTVSGP